MAVELTKVALWIETVDPGLPLGFFDAQIRCGDALLGVFDLKVLEDGIPDAAYKPLTGDDKDIASLYRKIIRQESDKVAFQNGFRRKLNENEGWASFSSTTVPGTIHLAAGGARGPWFLALDHTGVIEELDMPAVDMPGPGHARYAFETLGQVYIVLPRLYQLAASLPDAPLREFETKSKDLPKTTEAERLVVQRIGQDIFRVGLIEYWQGRCPMTGITDTALLRASHIVPWKDCASDAERLDVHNGLLLSALWDAAFDRGLVTFDDKGQPQFSPFLSDSARAELRWQEPILLTDKHRRQLTWHRTNLFVRQGGA